MFFNPEDNSDQGVLYFNTGTKCLVRMAVSMYSLRQFHKGPISLLQEGAPPYWLTALADWLGVAVRPVDAKGLPPLVFKARLHREAPYACNLFLDADTLVAGPLDELFPLVREHGFIVGKFARWSTEGRTMARRIRGMAPAAGSEAVGLALRHGPAINTGVFGFVPGAPFLEPWAALTESAWRKGCSNIPDELSCQILLPALPHLAVDEKFGESVKFGRFDADTRVVHYHGRKHTFNLPACGKWKSMYWRLMAKAPRDVAEALADPQGDRSLQRYLKKGGVTFVTAADKGYLHKLKANFPKLITTPGMCGEPWVCFVNGLDPADPELDFLRPLADVIPWDCPASSQRERMLSCFIKAAPEVVGTDHWVKVDADTEPRKAKFEPPSNWRGHVLASHRWHYTKPGKWLRMLEDWADKVDAFENFPRLFSEPELAAADKQLRYGHPRIASFICAHDTAFTRMCGALAERHGLPVPSHDTFFWYCAARLGKPVMRLNFKKMGFHP